MTNCGSVALSGIQRDCGANLGGVKTVWLVPNGTVTATITNNVVTSMSLASGSTWSKYQFKPGTAYMTSNLTKDATNGSLFWSTEVFMQFARMEAAKRAEINVLASAEAQGVVLDSNGTYWFVGKDEPIEATAGVGQTGTAKTDGNFYSITLTDNSLESPMPLSGSFISAMFV